MLLRFVSCRVPRNLGEFNPIGDDRLRTVRGLRRLGQPLPRFHEGEAQQVLALPLLGVPAAYVVRGEADAPERIEGAGLDEHVRTGCEEEAQHLLVLAELVEVAAD